jgi:hypothetical protein
LRARRPGDFSGAYTPLDAGPEICAFRRGDGVAVVVPVRLAASKKGVLAADEWVDVLPEYAVGLFVRRDA